MIIGDGAFLKMPRPRFDSASNNQVFIDFLAQLRDYYQEREDVPIFHSVILAGVYDIKNLKLKLCPDTEHLYNSPWNIAADFDIDMSFSSAIPRALKSLKYFCENAPEYHVAAAGSLLGVALHEGTSFPVGKVEFLDLYPLDYQEFLCACGEEPLTELLKSGDTRMITVFKNKYIDYLKMYYYVGGMPEAVVTYINSKDLKKVRVVQNMLLSAYENDFSKHAPAEIVTRIRMLWNSIPTQLARENKKFVYGLVREGARAREYEVALTWLADCGLVYRINRIKKPDFPLRAYQDFRAFKLFILDIGLLGAMTRLGAKLILEGNRMFEEFKGALTEQYVLQQLVNDPENDIFYWSSDTTPSEVDFILQNEDGIVPIEVKAEENLQAKSLRFFCEKFRIRKAVRTSMSNYRKQEWMVNVPLYLVGEMGKYI